MLAYPGLQVSLRQKIRQDQFKFFYLHLILSIAILDTEPSISYTNVTRISHYRMHIPVLIKISNEYIQILTVSLSNFFKKKVFCNKLQIGFILNIA
jgi:hypothetical protein